MTASSRWYPQPAGCYSVISSHSGSNLRRMRPADERREQLKTRFHESQGCVRCPHLAAERTTVVFGSGNADADLLFVGEAPGVNEDRRGLPFVGQAGQLLERLLE